MFEKDVGAHFACEWRPRFMHLRLDVAVPGFEDHRLAAHAFDLVDEHLAGFHICNDGRAGLISQDLTCGQNHDLITPENTPLTVDHADAIAVAIKAEADVAVFLGNQRFQLI